MSTDNTPIETLCSLVGARDYTRKMEVCTVNFRRHSGHVWHVVAILGNMRGCTCVLDSVHSWALSYTVTEKRVDL